MTTGIVAVPYYGRVHRAKFGYEKVYFLVDASSCTAKQLDVRLGVWDYKIDHSLPEWLKNNGVRSLVCREEPEGNLMKAMATLGIAVLSGADNDASQLMQTLMV